jgi:O-acetyl-ADP-ribose deacetylase (regulator of RNase III)
VIEQQTKIQNIWKAARRPFRWDQGIDPAISIAKGKITPEEAEREHQRQIEKGWDVEGNLKGDTGDG